MSRVSRALIVCIGNELVADDGAGQAVYDYLMEDKLPPDVRISLLGLGGIDLIEELHGEELLVVVDAVQLQGTPGTVHTLEWDQLPAMGPRPVSGHGIGVREAVHVARKLYPERCPANVYLVGIEGRCFDQLGKGLSPEVALAIPQAVRIVRSLVTLT